MADPHRDEESRLRDAWRGAVTEVEAPDFDRQWAAATSRAHRRRHVRLFSGLAVAAASLLALFFIFSPEVERRGPALALADASVTATDAALATPHLALGVFNLRGPTDFLLRGAELPVDWTRDRLIVPSALRWGGDEGGRP